MKKLLLVLALFSGYYSFSQSQFQVMGAGNGKILKGILSRTDISADSSFAWFQQNQKGYKPNASTVSALKENGNGIQIIAFGGTWCEDTRNILPKFFSIVDAAGFSDNQITLVGVDTNKKTISHLAEALNVEYVPTFIVMKAGKEVGRVVEYGKTGMWDKELGEVINLSSK